MFKKWILSPLSKGTQMTWSMLTYIIKVTLKLNDNKIDSVGNFIEEEFDGELFANIRVFKHKIEDTMIVENINYHS